MTGSIGDTATFDRVARFYDWFAPAPDADEFREALGFADREIERVLDVGGGTGGGASTLDAPERIVVDAAPGMVRRARRKEFEAVRGDAGRLPFGSATADAVLVVDALHHFGDPESAVREAARVLRPGGVLVIREIDPSALVGRLVAVGEHLYGFDSTFFEPAELAQVVADSGLDARYRTGGARFRIGGARSRIGGARIGIGDARLPTGGFEYTVVGRAPRES